MEETIMVKCRANEAMGSWAMAVLIGAASLMGCASGNSEGDDGINSDLTSGSGGTEGADPACDGDAGDAGADCGATDEEGSGGSGTMSGSGKSGKGGKGGAKGSGGGKSGKGGSAGSGGGSSGGKSGKGGSAGSGKSGSGGSGGSGGYAFLAPQIQERRHSVELASGGSETVPFTWHDASGLAPPADLWIEEAGKPVLQVSSLNNRPFARAGFDVVPLDPGSPYRVVLARKDDTLIVSLVGETGNVVLRTQAPMGDIRTAANKPSAAVVLPAAFWRSSVASDLL
jgi:hypothetical protein